MKSVRGVAIGIGIVAIAVVFEIPAIAKCPISDGATLVVRAPLGNLHVDTSGRDAVEVNVASSDISIREACGKDRVEYSADAPSRLRGSIDWRIVVPRTVNLDLVTLAGSITIGDSDAAV